MDIPLSQCLNDVVKILNNAKEKELENFNILDELWANENAHTRILYRLLQNKSLLDSFLKHCLAPVFKQPFPMDCNVELSCLSENNIDLCIHSSQYSIIIENKINGAMDQSTQIARYVQAEMRSYQNSEPIYVVYLTMTGGSPSDGSLTDEARRLLGFSDNSTGRFREMNYKDHILPWLKEKAPFTVSQPYLISGATQYIHYLEGRLSQREIPDGPQLVRNYLLEHQFTVEDKRKIEIEWCKAIRDRLDIWHNNASDSIKRAFFCRQLCDIFHITYNEADENDCWHQLFHDEKTGLTINVGRYLRTSPYSIQFSFEGGIVSEYQMISEQLCHKLSIPIPENINETTVYYYEIFKPDDIAIFVNGLLSVDDIPDTGDDLQNWVTLVIGNWRKTTECLYDDDEFAALTVMRSQWNLTQNLQQESWLISSTGLYLGVRYDWLGDFGLQFRDGESRVIDFWCHRKYENQNAIRDELLKNKISLDYICDYWNAGRYPYHFVFSSMEDGKKILDQLLNIRQALNLPTQI